MMSTEHADLTDHLVLRGGTEPLLPPATEQSQPKRVVLDWRQALGGLLILAGGIVLAVAWVGISGEAESYKQLPYFLSGGLGGGALVADRKSTRLNSSHVAISYAVFCLK